MNVSSGPWFLTALLPDSSDAWCSNASKGDANREWGRLATALGFIGDRDEVLVQFVLPALPFVRVPPVGRVRHALLAAIAVFGLERCVDGIK